MCADWRSAIEQAFALEEEILVQTRPFIHRLYQRGALELADHLNAELRGLAFAAAGCESLHLALMARVKAGQSTDHERRLSYPFYTDAIFAAFNVRKFVESSEMREKVGNATVERMLASFDQNLPRTVEASNAIRHHHDRAFGRVRTKQMAENGQFVAVWGSKIKVTDQRLNEFWYEFSPSSVRALVISLAAILSE